MFRGSLIDLSTLTPQKDLVEKSFDLEPQQLQSAIETGSFEITEMFDHRSLARQSEAVYRNEIIGLR